MDKFDPAGSIFDFDRYCADMERSARESGQSLENALDPEQALEQLKKGNKAFMQSKRPCLEVGSFEPEGSTKVQSPIAVIVCCSDSRVPPELVFWQGLGRLFVVRVAGNIVDAAAFGSIVYAVKTFGTRLVVVLGHERCGAVETAVKYVTDGSAYGDFAAGIIEPVLPAVLAAQRKNPCDLVEASVRENVSRTVDALHGRLTSVPGEPDRLRLVGARYDINDGCVDFFYPAMFPTPIPVA